MTHFDIPHVGDILNEEFIKPLGLSQNALAKAIGVPSNRINNIVNGKIGISPETDLRLTTYFSLSEGYFLRLQTTIQLTLARRGDLPRQLAQIIPFSKIASQKNEHKEDALRA